MCIQMSTEVVQFRFPSEGLEYLRKHGIHPNEEAKKQLERLLQSLKFEESFDYLRRHPFKNSFDPAQAVREARDDH